ncbi:conserved Plasmodium protein, unknown function [Plasmodium gallinaceum]|uniref:Chorein N-terminal domain-containing protein n=1 Tax=Plasmodium gallinaceum TaxID=5849 RepID=A0A1J1GLV3_PLAGA|nr:conserved Plasmodium protein, unknown function [Plasmodium gallinaceum]CRG93205.1 conserved Plasmodium protein, unknown function [Plasmodium gallinaceum]
MILLLNILKFLIGKCTNKYIKVIKNICVNNIKNYIFEEIEFNQFSFNCYDHLNNSENNSKEDNHDNNGNFNNSKEKIKDYIVYLSSLKKKKNDLLLNICYIGKLEIDWNNHFDNGLNVNVENIYINIKLDEKKIYLNNYNYVMIKNNAKELNNEENNEIIKNNFFFTTFFFIILHMGIIKKKIYKTVDILFKYFLYILTKSNISHFFKKIFFKYFLKHIFCIDINNINIIFEDNILDNQKNIYFSFYIKNVHIDNHNYIKNIKKENSKFKFNNDNNKNIERNENIELFMVHINRFSVYLDMRKQQISKSNINLNKIKYKFFFYYNINFFHKRKCLIEDSNASCIISKDNNKNKKYIINFSLPYINFNLLNDNLYILYLFFYKYLYIFQLNKEYRRKNKYLNLKEKKINAINKNAYSKYSSYNNNFGFEKKKKFMYVNKKGYTNNNKKELLEKYKKINNNNINNKTNNEKDNEKDNKINNRNSRKKRKKSYDNYIRRYFEFNVNIKKLKLSYIYTYSDYFFCSYKNINTSFFIKEERLKNKKREGETCYTLNDFIFLVDKFFMMESYSQSCLCIDKRKYELLSFCKKGSILKKVEYNVDYEYSLLKHNNVLSKINKKNYINQEKNNNYCLFIRYNNKKNIKKNISINIQSVYFIIEKIQNFYSLIKKLFEQDFYIFKNLINNGRNNDKNNKKNMSPIINFNIYFNNIKVKLKRFDKSFFICLDDVIFFYTNENINIKKVGIARNLLSSNFSFLKQMKKKWISYKNNVNIYYKVTNIYSFIQYGKFSHILVFPFSLFFSLDKLKSYKIRIDILSLVVELNSFILKILRVILFNEEDFLLDNYNNYDKEAKTTFLSTKEDEAILNYPENEKYLKILYDYKKEEIIIQNELNLLFGALEIFFDHNEIINRNFEEELNNLSFCLTYILKIFNNAKIRFSCNSMNLYFFCYNNFLYEKKKKKKKKKKFLNILSFTNYKNDTIRKHNDYRIDVFYFKLKLENIYFNFFVNNSDLNDSNSFLIFKKLYIRNIFLFFDFHFKPISLYFVLFEGLKLYKLVDQEDEKKIIKLKYDSESIKDKKCINNITNKKKYALIIKQKCQLIYTKKTYKYEIKNNHMFIIYIDKLNIYIFDFFVNLLYYFYYNSKLTKEVRKSKKKITSNNVTVNINNLDTYSLSKKMIKLIKDIKTFYHIIIKNVYKYKFYFIMKMISFYFIFHDNIEECEDNYTSDLFNKHFKFKLEYIIMKGKNNLVKITKKRLHKLPDKKREERNTNINNLDMNEKNKEDSSNFKIESKEKTECYNLKNVNPNIKNYSYISKFYLNVFFNYLSISRYEIKNKINRKNTYSLNKFKYHKSLQSNNNSDSKKTIFKLNNKYTNKCDIDIKENNKKCNYIVYKKKNNYKKKEVILMKIEKTNIIICDIYNMLFHLDSRKIKIFSYINFIYSLNYYMKLLLKTFHCDFFKKKFIFSEVIKADYEIDKIINFIKDKKKYSYKICKKRNYESKLSYNRWSNIFSHVYNIKKIYINLNSIYWNLILSDTRKNKKKEMLFLNVKNLRFTLLRDITIVDKKMVQLIYSFYNQIFYINLYIKSKKDKNKFLIFHSNCINFYNQIKSNVHISMLKINLNNFVKKNKKKSNILRKNSLLNLKIYCLHKSYDYKKKINFFFKILNNLKKKVYYINHVLPVLKEKESCNKFNVKTVIKSYNNRNEKTSKNNSSFYIFINEKNIASLMDFYGNIMKLKNEIKIIWNNYNNNKNKKKNKRNVNKNLKNSIYRLNKNNIKIKSNLEKLKKKNRKKIIFKLNSYLQDKPFYKHIQLYNKTYDNKFNKILNMLVNSFNSIKFKIKNVFLFFYTKNMSVFIGAFIKNLNGTLIKNEFIKTYNMTSYNLKYIHELKEAIVFSSNSYFNYKKNLYIFEIYNSLTKKNSLIYLNPLFYFFKKQNINLHFSNLKKRIKNISTISFKINSNDKQTNYNQKKLLYKQDNIKKFKHIQKKSNRFLNRKKKDDKNRYNTSDINFIRLFNSKNTSSNIFKSLLKDNKQLCREYCKYIKYNEIGFVKMKNRIFLKKIYNFLEKNIIFRKLNYISKMKEAYKERNLNKGKLYINIKYVIKKEKDPFLSILLKHIYKNIFIYIPLNTMVDLNKILSSSKSWKFIYAPPCNIQNKKKHFLKKKKNKLFVFYHFKILFINTNFHILSPSTYLMNNINENGLNTNEMNIIENVKKYKKNYYNHDDMNKLKCNSINDNKQCANKISSNGINKKKYIYLNEVKKKYYGTYTADNEREIEKNNLYLLKKKKVQHKNEKERIFLFDFIISTNMKIDVEKKIKIKKLLKFHDGKEGKKKKMYIYMNKINFNTSLKQLKIKCGILYICLNLHYIINIIRLEKIVNISNIYKNSKFYLNLVNIHKFQLLRDNIQLKKFSEKRKNKINFIFLKEYCIYNISEIVNILFFFNIINYELNKDDYIYYRLSKRNDKYILQNNHNCFPFKEKYLSEDEKSLINKNSFFRNLYLNNVKTSNGSYSSICNYNSNYGNKNENNDNNNNRNFYNNNNRNNINFNNNNYNNIDNNSYYKRCDNRNYNNEIYKLEKEVSILKMRNQIKRREKEKNKHYNKILINKNYINIIISNLFVCINNNDLLILKFFINDLNYIKKKLKTNKICSCKYKYDNVIISSKFKKNVKELKNEKQKTLDKKIITKNKINITIDILKIFFITKVYLHEIFSINSFNNNFRIDNSIINNKIKKFIIFLIFKQINIQSIDILDISNFIYNKSKKTQFIESFDFSSYYSSSKKNKFFIYIKDDINVNLSKNIINFFFLFKYNFFHNYFIYNEYNVVNQLNNQKIHKLKDFRNIISYQQSFLREYIIIRNFTIYNIIYEYEDNIGYIKKNEENLIICKNLFLLNIYSVEDSNLRRKVFIKNKNNNKNYNKINEKNYFYVDINIHENKKCINIYPYFFISIIYSKYNKKILTNSNLESRKNAFNIKLKFIKNNTVNTLLIKDEKMLFSFPFHFIKNCKFFQIILKINNKVYTSNKIKYNNILKLNKYELKDIYDKKHILFCSFFYLIKKMKKLKINKNNESNSSFKLNYNITQNITKKDYEYNEYDNNNKTYEICMYDDNEEFNENIIDKHENNKKNTLEYIEKKKYSKVFSIFNITKKNVNILSIQSSIRIINLSPFDISVLLKKEKGKIKTYNIKNFDYVNIYDFCFLKNIILNFSLSPYRQWIKFIKVNNEEYFIEKNIKGNCSYNTENDDNNTKIIFYELIKFKNFYFIIYIYFFENSYNITFLSKYNVYNYTKNILHYYIINEEKNNINDLKFECEVKKHTLKEKYTNYKENLFILQPLLDNKITFVNDFVEINKKKNYKEEKENMKYIKNYCFNHRFSLNHIKSTNTDSILYDTNKSYAKVILLNDEYITINIKTFNFHTFTLSFIYFYPYIILVNLTKYDFDIKMKNYDVLEKIYQDNKKKKEKKNFECEGNHYYDTYETNESELLNFSECTQFSLSNEEEIFKNSEKNVTKVNKYKKNNKIINFYDEFKLNNNEDNLNILRSMHMQELKIKNKSTWDFLSLKIKKKEREKEKEKEKEKEQKEKTIINFESAMEILKKNPSYKTNRTIYKKKNIRCKYMKIHKNMRKYFYLHKCIEITTKNNKNLTIIKQRLFYISSLKKEKTHYIFIKEIPFLTDFIYSHQYEKNILSIENISKNNLNDVKEKISLNACIKQNVNIEKEKEGNIKKKKIIRNKKNNDTYCDMTSKNNIFKTKYKNKTSNKIKKKNKNKKNEQLCVEKYEHVLDTHNSLKKMSKGLHFFINNHIFYDILNKYKELINKETTKKGKVFIFNNLGIPLFVSSEKSNYLFFINTKYVYFKEKKHFYFYFPKFIFINRKLKLLFKVNDRIHKYYSIRNYIHLVKNKEILKNFHIMKICLIYNFVSSFYFYSFVLKKKKMINNTNLKKKVDLNLTEKNVSSHNTEETENNTFDKKYEIIYYELYLVKFHCDIILNKNNEINIIINGLKEFSFLKNILSFDYFFHFLRNENMVNGLKNSSENVLYSKKKIPNVIYTNNLYGLCKNDLMNIKIYIKSLNILFNFEGISSNSGVMESIQQKINLSNIYLNFYTFQYFNNKTLINKKRCIQFYEQSCVKKKSYIKHIVPSIKKNKKRKESFFMHNMKYLKKKRKHIIKDDTNNNQINLKNSELNFSPYSILNRSNNYLDNELLNKQNNNNLISECNKKFLSKNAIHNLYFFYKNNIYCHYYSYIFTGYIKNIKLYQHLFNLLRSKILSVCINYSDFYKKISILIDNMSITKINLYDKKEFEYKYTILTKHNNQNDFININIDLYKQRIMKYKHIYNTLNILHTCTHINKITKRKEKMINNHKNITNEKKSKKDTFFESNNIYVNSNNFSRNYENAILYNAYYFYKKKKSNLNNNYINDINDLKNYKINNLVNFIENIKIKKSQKQKKEIIKNLSIDIASLILTLDYNYFINVIPFFYDYFCKKLNYYNIMNNLKFQEKRNLNIYYDLLKIVEKNKYEEIKNLKILENYSLTKNLTVNTQIKEDKFLLYIYDIDIKKTKIYINVNYLLKLFLTKNFLMNISSIKINNKKKKNIEHILKKIKKIYFYNYIDIFFYLLKNLNISENTSYTMHNFLSLLEKFLKNNLQLSPLHNLYSFVVTLKYKCEHKLDNKNKAKINKDNYSINKNISNFFSTENNALLFSSEFYSDGKDKNKYLKNFFSLNYSNFFSKQLFINSDIKTNEEKEKYEYNVMKQIIDINKNSKLAKYMNNKLDNKSISDETIYSKNVLKKNQEKLENDKILNNQKNIKNDKKGVNLLKKYKKKKKSKKKKSQKSDISKITRISFTHNLNITK